MSSEQTALPWLFAPKQLFFWQEKQLNFENIDFQDKPLWVFTPKMEPQDQELLENILKAVSYTKAQYCVIELTQEEQVNFAECCKNATFQYALVFGLLPAQLLLNINPNLHQIFSLNNIQFLWSLDLTSINDSQNRSHKKMLWQQLQQLFLSKG